MNNAKKIQSIAAKSGIFKARKAKKGASQLHLNNKELRRELHRADVIIMTAVSVLSPAQQQSLKHQLERCHTTEATDPLAETTRLRAMHRITPKCDPLKLILIAASVILALAWFSTQTEVQLLQAEAAQIDYDR